MKFTTTYEIRISDLNYGNHVGNDRYITISHEARVRFLHSLGFNELEIGANKTGLLVKELHAKYSAQLFYPDIVDIEFSFFDIHEKIMMTKTLLKKSDKKIAEIDVKIVSFDYKTQKVVPFDTGFIKIAQNYS